MQLTEFIEKIDKPKELFEALNKAQVNTALEFDAILVEFSAQPGVDLCLLALEALKAGANKWITEGIVIPKLNKLSPNVESLALLMNGLEGIIYQKDLEEFLTKTPDFARRLLTKFINENNGFIEGYIITCYNALLKNEEFDSFQEIVDLKSNSSLIIQHSVISLLSSFNYETSSNKDEFLKTTLQVLQEFEQKAESDNELLPRLVWAYCQLITQSEKAEEKLIKLLDKNNPDSDLKLAQFLFVNTDKFYLNEWFQKLLNRLTKVSTQYVETLNRIDMIFFMALARHKSWVGAKEFIRKWLTDSDYTKNKKDFETLFPSFLRELIKNKPELELWITELFNKEDIYWNALAGDTVSYFKSHNMDGLLQLTVDTGSYNIYDIKYIFRKILAFVIYPDVMCSLVLSVLEKKDDEDIKGLVNSMMTEIVDEYLGAVLDFTNKELLRTELSSKIRKYLEAIKRDLEKYTENINKIPKLDELKTPLKNSYIIGLSKRKERQKTAEESEKKSVLAQLVSRIYLKQGIGSFSFHNNEYTEINKLTSFSVSMALPLSEACHPVHGARTRFQYRLSKKESL